MYSGDQAAYILKLDSEAKSGVPTLWLFVNLSVCPFYVNVYPTMLYSDVMNLGEPSL